MVQVQEGKRTFRQRWRERVASARFRVDLRNDSGRAFRDTTDSFRLAQDTRLREIGSGLRQAPDTGIERRRVDTGLNPSVTLVQDRYMLQALAGLEWVRPVAHKPSFTSATFEIEGRPVILNIGAEHQILDIGKTVKLVRIEQDGLLPVAVVEVNGKETELEVGKPTVNIDGVRIRLDTFPDVARAASPWNFPIGTDPFGPLNPWQQQPFRFGAPDWGKYFDYTRSGLFSPNPFGSSITDGLIVAVDSAIKRVVNGVRNTIVAAVIAYHVRFSRQEEEHQEPEPRVKGLDDQ